MKKIIIALLMCSLSYPMMAQLPWVSHSSVHADPVQRPPVDNTGSVYDPLGYGTVPPPRVQNNTSYETIYAYIVRNNKFQKIKIKVYQKGSTIYVNSYYDKETNMWYNAFNTNASQTTRYDGDVIYNNFDYKASVSGLGYVYF